MSEHTRPKSPLPWGVAQDSTLFDANIKMIGGMESYTNAEYIVRCVNAHDELVAALEHVASWDYSAELPEDTLEGFSALARKALAKARGEQP